MKHTRGGGTETRAEKARTSTQAKERVIRRIGNGGGRRERESTNGKKKWLGHNLMKARWKLERG